MIGELRHQTGGSVRQVCHSLGLPRSSYYREATESASQRNDRALGDYIEIIFKKHRGRYGYRRIHSELHDEGHSCGTSRVRRIMKAKGLRAIQPRHFVPRTSDGRADAPAANLLLREPLPMRTNQVWAGDITYVAAAKGWLYLAVVIDLYSRRIVGWSLARNMRAGLVVEALRQATETRRTEPGAIFHSDRGSQYGSGAFRAELAGAGLRQSMSAKANPYDNAKTESFMGTLKREMLRGGEFETLDDAKTEIFDYIECYYNTRRKHSSLGYLSPMLFEKQKTNLN